MLGAIEKELTMRAPTNQNQIETIYFGGGTPSLLQPVELASILKTIHQHYHVHPKAEITLEANPDDLDFNKLKHLKTEGINRLSLGIQSFHDRELKMMNRAHDSTQAIKCLEQSRVIFDNLSVDLIYGMPESSLEDWDQNLSVVQDFDVPHLSAYALTVEPKTALQNFIYKGLITPLDESEVWAQFNQLSAFANRNNFVHYELSNFGKTGYFSANNTAYWQGKPYLGIGPSAHSFDLVYRSWNVANNVQYIKSIESGLLPNTTEKLTKVDRYNEFVMTGLRTMWGISLEKIKLDLGPRFAEYLLQESKVHIQDGLLEWNKECLVATPKGKYLTDGIASNLFMLNL